MKIQKAIFSCSEPPAYSSYWNMLSRLYREGLDIEPVCLLFGKRGNTDMNETYGRVIEREIAPDLPWVLQMTLSKFEFTRSEPETIWITGDVDMLPLCRRHFIDNIAPVPDDHYLSLNANGFINRGSQRHGKDGGFTGYDLPAHYHVAKGGCFERLYFGGKTLREVLQYMVDSGRYGMGALNGWPAEQRKENPYQYYWIAEEMYTSELLWNAIQAGQVKYQGFGYDNVNHRIGPWNGHDYQYNPEMVRAHHYVDNHCYQVRPYALQAEALERIIRLSGLLVNL